MPSLTRRLVDSTLAHPWVERDVLSTYLEDINPMWSLTEQRARIVEIRDETHDSKTFVLRPGRWFDGFVAGQHLGVAFEIDGVTHRRRYSLSSAPGDKTIEITTKRVPDGRVSNWMHDHLRAGDVIRVDAIAGDFVLPQKLPAHLLMLAAGSGITPLMSQTRALLATGYTGDIAFVHYVRSPADRIFGAELEALATQHANLRVQWCYENDGQGGDPERFSPAQLATRVSDHDTRHTMLCGPAGFMEAVRAHFGEVGRADALQYEYFGAAPLARPADGAQAAVALERKARQITAGAGRTLLEALEEAGETPVAGCRMGICHSCKCHKTSGTVRNLITGEVSTDPDQDIQLCVSVAEGDVTLDY